MILAASTHPAMEARKKASIRIAASTAANIRIVTARSYYYRYRLRLAAKPEPPPSVFSTLCRRHYYPAAAIHLGLAKRFIGNRQRLRQRVAVLHGRNAD